MLFGKWSGTEVRIDGEDLLIMKESDIMGVVEQTVGDEAQGRLIGAQSISTQIRRHSPWLPKT